MPVAVLCQLRKVGECVRVCSPSLPCPFFFLPSCSKAPFVGRPQRTFSFVSPTSSSPVLLRRVHFLQRVFCALLPPPCFSNNYPPVAPVGSAHCRCRSQRGPGRRDAGGTRGFLQEALLLRQQPIAGQSRHNVLKVHGEGARQRKNVYAVCSPEGRTSCAHTHDELQAMPLTQPNDPPLSPRFAKPFGGQGAFSCAGVTPLGCKAVGPNLVQAARLLGTCLTRTQRLLAISLLCCACGICPPVAETLMHASTG